MSMNAHYSQVSELPYIDLDRIEELRRLQSRCWCCSREERPYQRGCLDHQHQRRECPRERRDCYGCGMDEFNEGEDCIFGRRYCRGDSNMDPSYDLGFENMYGRPSILHPGYSVRMRAGGQRCSSNEGCCIYCNSSLEKGPSARERDSLCGQDRRVHSYYKQCLSEDSDANSSRNTEQGYDSEREIGEGRSITRRLERPLSGEYSDLSEDVQMVIKRNNRHVVSLALNWISLSGEHNKKIRKFVTDSMDSLELKDVPHFVILFQYDDHKGIRGLYSYFHRQREWQCVVEITPNCPKVIHKEMIHTLYKFDTCQKLFRPISRLRRITDVVDGLSVKNEYLSKTSS